MLEQIHITSLIGGKKIFFASDFHLGSPTDSISRERERRIVTWLDSIKDSAHSIYLVGDIFDFWYEYKRAIPKGFVRFQAKIAEITDSGTPVYFFTGNHDMWMFDYFEKELGVKIFRKEIELTVAKHTFLIGHGDGLGPKDHLYKFFKMFFASKICQWTFGRLHPNFGIGLANFWSKSSRKKGDNHPEVYLGEDEWLLQHCKEQEAKKHHDFYIYGHRHLVIDHKVAENARYLNIGHWFGNGQYGVYDGSTLDLIELDK